MQILSGIDIQPFPVGSASMLELKRVWEREAGRARAELDGARGATDTARRGAVEIAAEAPAVQRNAGDVARGVHAADPNNEQWIAFRAQQNGTGASHAIGDAERNAGDPRFAAPAPNYGSAGAKTAGPAGGIEGGGREVARASREADRLEAESAENTRRRREGRPKG